MRTKKDDICACIVTYSDRRGFLKKNIASLAANGVSKVFVLFNGVPYDAGELCREIRSELKVNLSFISLPYNSGSAGGYSKLITEALKTSEVSSLLLLDDDNEVVLGGIDEILKVHGGDGSRNGSATLGYRVDRRAYQSMMKSRPAVFPFGLGGSYAGIDIRSWLNRRFSLVNYSSGATLEGSVPYCCYGGLLIDKDIVRIIGVPDCRYFLYNDDHEWTYRITNAGKSIRIAPECKINDLERSWGESEKTGSVFRSLRSSSREEFLFLTIRNRLWFERSLSRKAPAIRLLNFFVFNILAVSACVSNPKRFRSIFLAQLHGLRR